MASLDLGETLSFTTSLPQVGRPVKMSTALCSIVFDDLEMALLSLEAGRNHLDPIQRELVDRFAKTCSSFVRDMLVAEGNPDALRMAFGLSPTAAR